MSDSGFPAEEIVALDQLRPHPRNYRAHPADQVEHLARSIAEHGLYRNVVLAQDNTLLAGHGVVEALRQLGRETVRAVRLPIPSDSPAALKVLTGDNEIEHLAEQDDRALSELLKELADFDPAALLGTGYDQAMLANLVMVTRPASEIKDMDEAAHWAGMPDYGEPQVEIKLVVSFDAPEKREKFMEQIGLDHTHYKYGDTWSTWWPPRDREDLISLRFESGDDE